MQIYSSINSILDFFNYKSKNNSYNKYSFLNTLSSCYSEKDILNFLESLSPEQILTLKNQCLNNYNKSYQKFKVPDLKDEIKELMELRLKMVSNL